MATVDNGRTDAQIDSAYKLNSDPRRCIRVQIVQYGVSGASQDAGAWPGHSFLAPHTAVVCKTVSFSNVSFSKEHSESPDVAPLPNLAVYENQGGSAALRRGPGFRAGLWP
jgi:hypothetical protein